MKRWEVEALNRRHFVTDRGDETQDELNEDSYGKIVFGCIENLND
jgi:hypothetical protein